MASSGKDVAVSHRLAPRRQALLRLRLQIQKRFRRPLRRLMRPTFGAAKVGKTAHAAKAPGKLRRVPCVSRTERPVPNSLPLVAQTCGTGMPRSLLRYSAPSRQMGGRRTLGACRSVSSERSEPAPPAVAAAEHCRAGRKKGRRMSERRERSDHSEFGGPRPDRNAQGTGPEAASAAVGPAASPGSVSWLLLGAPRSNSHQPAKPAAKRPLKFSTKIGRKWWPGTDP